MYLQDLTDRGDVMQVLFDNIYSDGILAIRTRRLLGYDEEKGRFFLQPVLNDNSPKGTPVYDGFTDCLESERASLEGELDDIRKRESAIRERLAEINREESEIESDEEELEEEVEL